jgi:hypothetical protein
MLSSVIMIIIAVVPVLNFVNLGCCAGIVAGGVAGAIYYNNQLKKVGETIQYKDGAAIGILSGFLSAIIVVVFTTLLSMVINQNPIPEIYRVFDHQGYTLPPNAEQFLKRISDEYSKNGFSITLTLITLAMDIILYPLFGAVGGLLTVSVVGKRKNVEFRQ